MFSNIFKLIFRNLYRYKYYSIVNILGLSIGVAALVWAWQTYRFSFSYDRFHQDRDQIFRILSKIEGRDVKLGVCPLPLGPMAKADLSAVSDYVRLENINLSLKAGQEEALNSRVTYTDPSFFDFFNFPLVAGVHEIGDRSNILLTETSAKKIFGTKDPLGQTVLLHAGESYQQPMKVAGVLKDPPVNSSIQFELITNMENYVKNDSALLKADDWTWLADAIFLKIPDPANAVRVEKELTKYAPIQAKARQDLKAEHFILDPLDEVANHDRDIASNVLSQRPEDSAAYGPLVLALLILISSCLNFANTTVARSNQRLKEMGVRKVLGGNKMQLIRQSLLECGLMVFLAVLLSTLLNSWWLPVFNNMFTGIKISADYFSDPVLLRTMFWLWLGVTLIAGLYPAFYISRYNATQIFRGSVKFGGTNLFSRVLLGLQLLVACITVIAGFAFSRNSDFQKNFDFGFAVDDVFSVQLNKNTFDAYHQALSQAKSVEALAGTRGHISSSYKFIGLEAKGEKKETRLLEVGDRYEEVMELQLLSGRWFKPFSTADLDHTIVLSEKAASEFGWTAETALGQQVKWDTVHAQVIGVTKDLYMTAFFDPIEPVAFAKVQPSAYRTLVVKSRLGQVNAAFDEARAIWSGLYPMKPFNAFYQNEIAAEAHRVNASIATIFFWFAIISALLTATGLFALISLTILKKLREIAIRRVVGASPGHIVFIVNKSYILIFVLSLVLGVFAGIALTRLLMDLIFVVNVGVHGPTLVYSIAGILLLVAVTLGIKIWHTLSLKPSEVLRANQ
ncbi:MAG TPA: ABC transporter permease [Saprospiraceae bacterium]|nr:ABC transporter permease [Saprospiraceae bacterium]